MNCVLHMKRSNHASKLGNHKAGLQLQYDAFATSFVSERKFRILKIQKLFELIFFDTFFHGTSDSFSWHHRCVAFRSSVVFHGNSGLHKQHFANNSSSFSMQEL